MTTGPPTLTSILASIPSPPGKSIGIGPLQLRAYGLAIAMWAVPMGLVGARLYHVITDYQRFQGRWWRVLEVWEGGLGIPGGLLAGVITGVVIARRRGLDVPTLLDVVAPAIPLAQAIGRLGNWFNQELFGRASDLPWAVRIDPEHRPDGFEHVATYHPTFLYEALWNLALAAVLVRLDRTRRLRRGQLFVLYVAGYALGRLWVEALRIDPANEILGLRVNIWTSVVALGIAAAAFVIGSRRRPPVSAPADRSDGERAGQPTPAEPY